MREKEKEREREREKEKGRGISVSVSSIADGLIGAVHFRPCFNSA